MRIGSKGSKLLRVVDALRMLIPVFKAIAEAFRKQK